jgi:Flp pilus assembly protein TadG
MTARAVRRRGLRRFLRSEAGAAAAEFALILTVMVVPVLNVIDLGFYAFRKMQVELAAEAGVQAIRGACTPAQAPVTKNCATGLLTKITTAVQGTSLGTAVSVATGSPLEGYYCVNASQALVPASNSSTGTIGSPPNLNGATCPSGSPADYVQVSVNYAHTPIFAAVTVAGLLPSPIARTAWYRVR